MKKYNHYGLKNNQFLYTNPERKENYFYKIFSDGSATVIIKKYNDNNYLCIFGNLEHCRRLYKQHKHFEKNNTTLAFYKVLTA